MTVQKVHTRQVLKPLVLQVWRHLEGKVALGLNHRAVSTRVKGLGLRGQEEGFKG